MADDADDLKYDCEVSTRRIHTWQQDGMFLSVTCASDKDGVPPRITEVEFSLPGGDRAGYIGERDIEQLREACALTATALDPEQLKNLNEGRGINFERLSPAPSGPTAVELAQRELLRLLWSDEALTVQLDVENWSDPESARSAAEYLVSRGMLLRVDRKTGFYVLSPEGKRVMQDMKASQLLAPTHKKSRRGH